MVGGIQGLENVLRRVSRLATDTRHVEKPLNAVGVYMRGSIEKNFKAQGRPNKWQALAPSTIKSRLRDKRHKSVGGIRILIRTADMKNAVGHRLVSTGVQIGLTKDQAARMHFGYPGGSGPGHSKTPARPFVMFQQEDIREIGEIFSRHVRS